MPQPLLALPKEEEKEKILFDLIEEEKAMDDEWNDNNNTWTNEKNECENILSEVQDLEAEKLTLKACLLYTSPSPRD